MYIGVHHRYFYIFGLAAVYHLERFVRIGLGHLCKIKPVCYGALVLGYYNIWHISSAAGCSHRKFFSIEAVSFSGADDFFNFGIYLLHSMETFIRHHFYIRFS